VKYELGFYIPEDDILHSDRREHLNSYMNIYYRQALGHRKGSSYSSWMICDITITRSTPAPPRIIRLQQQQQRQRQVRAGLCNSKLVR
jgi:hypothetical protein